MSGGLEVGADGDEHSEGVEGEHGVLRLVSRTESASASAVWAKPRSAARDLSFRVGFPQKASARERSWLAFIGSDPAAAPGSSAYGRAT